jgi:hypothetical protein
MRVVSRQMFACIGLKRLMARGRPRNLQSANVHQSRRHGRNHAKLS